MLEKTTLDFFDSLAEVELHWCFVQYLCLILNCRLCNQLIDFLLLKSQGRNFGHYSASMVNEEQWIWVATTKMFRLVSNIHLVVSLIYRNNVSNFMCITHCCFCLLPINKLRVTCMIKTFILKLFGISMHLQYDKTWILTSFNVYRTSYLMVHVPHLVATS